MDRSGSVQARCRAVLPSLSERLGSAPRDSRYKAAQYEVLPTASISGVCPFLSRALQSAPASKSSAIRLTRSFSAALCRPCIRVNLLVNQFPVRESIAPRNR